MPYRTPSPPAVSPRPSFWAALSARVHRALCADHYCLECDEARAVLRRRG